MTFRILGGSLLAAWAMTAAAPAMRAQEPQPAASINDGVYTEEQAKRGEPMYGEFCASCHGPALSGGEMAPPLVGGDFASSWVGLSLNDLFERMRISMPQNKPGSLSRQQNADILAFMLASGKYPAGKTELAKENEVLKTIKFEAPK
jgi:mono/diheme cytochrome c family protein